MTTHYTQLPAQAASSRGSRALAVLRDASGKPSYPFDESEISALGIQIISKGDGDPSSAYPNIKLPDTVYYHGFSIMRKLIGSRDWTTNDRTKTFDFCPFYPQSAVEWVALPPTIALAFSVHSCSADAKKLVSTELLACWLVAHYYLEEESPQKQKKPITIILVSIHQKNIRVLTASYTNEFAETIRKGSGDGKLRVKVTLFPQGSEDDGIPQVLEYCIQEAKEVGFTGNMELATEDDGARKDSPRQYERGGTTNSKPKLSLSRIQEYFTGFRKT